MTFARAGWTVNLWRCDAFEDLAETIPNRPYSTCTPTTYRTAGSNNFVFQFVFCINIELE